MFPFQWIPKLRIQVSAADGSKVLILSQWNPLFFAAKSLGISWMMNFPPWFSDQPSDFARALEKRRWVIFFWRLNWAPRGTAERKNGTQQSWSRKNGTLPSKLFGLHHEVLRVGWEQSTENLAGEHQENLTDSKENLRETSGNHDCDQQV